MLSPVLSHFHVQVRGGIDVAVIRRYLYLTTKKMNKNIKTNKKRKQKERRGTKKKCRGREGKINTWVLIVQRPTKSSEGHLSSPPHLYRG